jgi:tripartite ATP-independent transporter DctP family solute receptor
MKKTISIILTLIMVITLFSGCAQTPTATTTANQNQTNTTQVEEEKTVTLKLAVESAIGTPGEMSGQRFKEMVEERSEGTILIDYYPVGQLGTGDSLTEQMQTGTVDMSWRAIEWYSKFEPGWNILLMGFLFRDVEHLYSFLESEKQVEFKENLLNNANLRMIADNGIGSPRVLISKKPVNAPEDMSGMNMRVPGIEMYMKTWQGIGVNTVSVPWGEAYMALSQGTVDALESPLGSIYGMKFFEVAKNIILTNHVYSPYVMVINENSYNKLSDNQKNILDECALEAGDLFTKYDEESVEKNIELMKEDGVTFNEAPDIAAFQNKLANVAEICEKEGLWPEGLYDYVQSLN